MIILILGLALWWGGHFWKRALPDAHAQMGGKAKGISAIVIIAGIVLMVIGYKLAESYDQVAVPSPLRHINNLLVLFAIYFMSPGPSKGAIFYKMRHPMLVGFKIWAFAHLMVNPDFASYILFGGLLAWAVVEVIVINRSDRDWTPPAKGSIAKDAMFMGASVILLSAIGFVHGLLGPVVFGG